MRIVYATESDYDYIFKRDIHICKELILAKIVRNEIYIIKNDEDNAIGWMRYGLFWDNTPFMNLIWIDDAYRGQGIGKEVVQLWEEEMKQKDFELVMTSTQADEAAQHFYRRLGYKDAGCLLLETQPLEILLIKKIK